MELIVTTALGLSVEIGPIVPTILVLSRNETDCSSCLSVEQKWDWLSQLSWVFSRNGTEYPNCVSVQ